MQPNENHDAEPVDTSDDEIRAALALIDDRRVANWHPGEGTVMRTLAPRVIRHEHHPYDVHLTITVADFLTTARRRYRAGRTTEAILADTVANAPFHVTVEVGGQAERGNPHWYRNTGHWVYPTGEGRSRDFGRAIEREVGPDRSRRTTAGDDMRTDWQAVQDTINTVLAAAPVVAPRGTVIRR